MINDENFPQEIELKIPSGLTPEQRTAYIERALQQINASQQQKPQTAAWQSALAGLTQGLTYNFADNIYGKVRSFFTGEDPQKLQEERNALYEKARKDHPTAYYSAYALGSLVPSIVTKKPAFPFSGTGVGAAFKSGAAQGALAGVGDAPPDRELGGATTGGVFGGLLGAAAPAVGGILKNAARGVGAVFPTVSSFAKSVAPDAATAARLGDEIRAARAAGQPFTVADAAGPEALQLIEAAANRPSPRLKDATQFLLERAADSYERVMEKLRTILSKDPDPFLAKEVIKSEIEDGIQPVFRDVLEKQGNTVIIDNKIIDALNSRPSAKSALKKAVSIMQDLGETPGLMTDKNGKVTGITLRTFDYVRKVLGDAAYQGIDLSTQSSAVKSQTVAIRKTLNEMMDAVRNQLPEYGKALDAYSSIFRVRDAIELGEKMANRPSGVALEAFKAMQSNPEKHAFAVGFFGTKLGTTSGQRNPAATLYGSPKARELTDTIITALSGERTAQDLAAFLRREQTMLSTGQRILGNSATARRWASAEEAGLTNSSIPSSLWNFLMGSFGRAFSNSAGSRRAAALLEAGLLSNPDTAIPQLQRVMQQRKMLEQAGQYAVSPLARLGVKWIGDNR